MTRLPEVLVHAGNYSLDETSIELRYSVYLQLYSSSSQEEPMDNLSHEKNFAAIAGGVLLFLGHLISLTAGGSCVNIASKTITFSAHLLLALGILGIYETVALSVGAAGRIGAILAVVGTIVVTSVVFVEIAAAGGADAGPVLRAPLAAQIASYGPLLFVFGLIVLGSAIGIAQGFSRIPGWLLVAGTLVFAGGSLFNSLALFTATAGGGITGAGFVWLGLLGLSKK